MVTLEMKQAIEAAIAEKLSAVAPTKRNRRIPQIRDAAPEIVFWSGGYGEDGVGEFGIGVTATGDSVAEASDAAETLALEAEDALAGSIAADGLTATIEFGSIELDTTHFDALAVVTGVINSKITVRGGEEGTNG